MVWILTFVLGRWVFSCPITRMQDHTRKDTTIFVRSEKKVATDRGEKYRDQT